MDFHPAKFSRGLKYEKVAHGSRFPELVGSYLQRFDRRAGSGDDAGRIRRELLIIRKQAVSHGVYIIDRRSPGSSDGERFAVYF